VKQQSSILVPIKLKQARDETITSIKIETSKQE
jgi:hypothetical protein